MPIITLTTDFGLRDHYVACMKGVILRIAPDTRIIDVTHDIPRHDIKAGAYALQQVIRWYPVGTVHVAVVDPGVGSTRRIIVARYSGQLIVAPDNGLISLIHHQLAVEQVRVVKNPALALPSISSTFHGRDIIAPVAARLAAGMPLRDVGPPTDHVEILPLPQPKWISAHAIRGDVIYVDVYGNLITNIPADDAATVIRHEKSAQVYVDEQCVGPIRSTFSDVQLGQAVAFVGSGGSIEIAVNGGSASEQLHVADPCVVEIR